MSVIVCLKHQADLNSEIVIAKFVAAIKLEKSGNQKTHLECILKIPQNDNGINGIRFLVGGEVRNIKDRRDLLLDADFCNFLYDEGWEILSADESVVRTNELAPIYIGSNKKKLINSISVSKIFVGDQYIENCSMVEVRFNDHLGAEKYLGFRLEYDNIKTHKSSRASIFSEKTWSFESRFYDNKAIITGLSSILKTNEALPIDFAVVWVVLPYGVVPFIADPEPLYQKQVIHWVPWRKMFPNMQHTHVVMGWKFEEVSNLPSWPEHRILIQYTLPPPAGWLTWLGFIIGILGTILAVISFLR